MRMREARFKLMGGHLVGALALAICDFSKISVQVNKINNLRKKSDYTKTFRRAKNIFRKTNAM